MNELPHTRPTSVLGFVKGLRTLLGLSDLPCIWLAGTEQDDETNCIVANALGLPVGASDHDDWGSESKWVMRLPSAAAAQIVGFATGLDWRADPAEVALPEELIDLAVSHHFAAVESDELGALAAWWVLDADTCEWLRFTPTQTMTVASPEAGALIRPQARSPVPLGPSQHGQWRRKSSSRCSAAVPARARLAIGLGAGRGAMQPLPHRRLR